MSSHFLLDSMASGERLAVGLIVEPLYMINCCPLASFRIVSLSFESLIMMGLGVDIFEFTLFEVFEHLLSYCC